MSEPVETGGEERAGHDATAICARVRLYRVQRGLAGRRGDSHAWMDMDWGGGMDGWMDEMDEMDGPARVR
jgi:hypothetical protein